MGRYIKNNLNNITYKSELNSPQTTYVHSRSVSCGLII